MCLTNWADQSLQDDPKHPTTFDLATGEIKTTKLRTSEVETYYGFGEKAFAEMSRDGKFIVNWNTDTFSYPIGTDPIYESIPFFTPSTTATHMACFSTTHIEHGSTWERPRPTDIRSALTAASWIILSLPAARTARRNRSSPITRNLQAERLCRRMGARQSAVALVLLS